MSKVKKVVIAASCMIALLGGVSIDAYANRPVEQALKMKRNQKQEHRDQAIMAKKEAMREHGQQMKSTAQSDAHEVKQQAVDAHQAVKNVRH